MTTATDRLSKAQEKLKAKMNSSFMFNLFMFVKLPSAFFCGVRLRSMDASHAEVSVPYKWFSQNPFRSTYFAAMAMAAEMSAGVIALLAIEGAKPGVSMLVTRIEGDFSKKATDLTTFRCEQGDELFAAVAKAQEGGEGVSVQVVSTGRNKAGEEVARFAVEWSFKQRSK